MPSLLNSEMLSLGVCQGDYKLRVPSNPNPIRPGKHTIIVKLDSLLNR